MQSSWLRDTARTGIRVFWISKTEHLEVFADQALVHAQSEMPPLDRELSQQPWPTPPHRTPWPRRVAPIVLLVIWPDVGSGHRAHGGEGSQGLQDMDLDFEKWIRISRTGSAS